ncbi:hypothetical protein [Agarivorans sp. QJM3NY_25]|uniref:hypothetical protein n=1 Tax=Agarivorans sp. QJM3NY_25 TaxID=3421430 RepID=UPI003D7CFB6D
MAITNPTLGEVDCAWCGSESPVRKNKNGKLYVICPNCGQQPLNLPGGQEQILTRARMYGAANDPAPQETPLPKAANDGITEEPAPAKKRGMFSFLDD